MDFASVLGMFSISEPDFSISFEALDSWSNVQGCENSARNFESELDCESNATDSLSVAGSIAICRAFRPFCREDWAIYRDPEKSTCCELDLASRHFGSGYDCWKI